MSIADIIRFACAPDFTPHPFLSVVPKRSGFDGSQYVVPVQLPMVAHTDGHGGVAFGGAIRKWLIPSVHIECGFTLPADIKLLRESSAAAVVGDKIGEAMAKVVVGMAERVPTLRDWLPENVTPSDNFYGLCRDGHPRNTALCGQLVDVSKFSIRDGLIFGAERLAHHVGARVTHAFIGKQAMEWLCAGEGWDADTMWHSLALDSSVGPIHFTVMRDDSLPPGEGYLVDIDTWELRRPGPNVVNVDEWAPGEALVMSPRGYDGRVSFHGNVYCRDLTHNARVRLAT